MPRDGSGVMSRVPGTEAAPNETITSSQFNTTIDDLVADANAARPVSAGGTGAASATDARTNLDVAQRVETVSDFTAGRGLIVGSGGLLGDAVPVTVTDANDLVTGGFWAVSNLGAVSNLPANLRGIVGVVRRSSTRIFQTFYEAETSGGGRQWTRTKHDGGWTAWELVATLVASGTVTDGLYWKYGDGRMDVRRRASFTTATNILFEVGYGSETVAFNFGQTFIAAPRVSLTPAGRCIGVSVNNITTTQVIVRFLSAISDGSAERSVEIAATGNWK